MKTLSIIIAITAKSLSIIVVASAIAIIALLVILILKITKMSAKERNIYEKEVRKRNPFECPYDIEGRSCKHMNTATGYLDVQCKDCDWYNNGVRPSKF